MDLDVLKTFCDLVDAGSFTKAADANFVTQSAVSQQLARLERELSAQLIERSGGLVRPTEAGQAFYQGAKEILRRFERLAGEVRSAAQQVRGVLRVGTIYSVGFYRLDPFLRKFLRLHPEVNLHVEYSLPERIYAAVAGGEMDLGVVAWPEKHRAIEVVPLAGEEMVAVFWPRHRLAKRKQIVPADLQGEKFVAFEANIPTRRNLDRLLKESRVPVSVVMEFDNIELIKRAIEVEAGVSILPRESVQREARYGELSFAQFEDSQRWLRPLAVIRRRGKNSSPAERMFLELLKPNEDK
jgi:LysR family transcriptional regulator, transcriptional activator of the cysJI operon